MNRIVLIILLVLTTALKAQKLKLNAINIGYYGETFTRPGLKIGINYNLKEWEKIKKKDKKSVILKSIGLNPSIGFFNHKNFQSSLFIQNEINKIRKLNKGYYNGYSIGLGYMRTFIPKVYELNSSGEIVKKSMGYNYLLTSLSYVFGKDLSIKYKNPITIYIKPQLIFALPSARSGVWYINCELGISYKLK